MSSVFDKCIEQAKANIKGFDETNPEHIELMIKGFVLTNKRNKEGQWIYDSYLKDLVEDRERKVIQQMIEDHPTKRNEIVTSRMEMLQLETDIINAKKKVLKEFMD